MNVPFFADYINGETFSGMSPSQVHVANTMIYQYFRRHLLHTAVSVFKWQLPREWEKTLFLYALYCDGHVAVVNTPEYGVLPQPCTLSGRGVQYQPTHALIANPLLPQPYRPEIGTECAVVRLMPDYGGLMDVVNYYAREMSVAAETFELNTLNSKLSFIFGVQKTGESGSRKGSAEALKKVYDNIQSGVPASFVDANLLNRDGKPTWSLFEQHVKENFIAPELLEIIRKLEERFCCAVGLPANLATTKKERLIVDEVNANNAETASGPSMWLDTIRDGLEVANELFGLQLAVDWRVDPDV